MNRSRNLLSNFPMIQQVISKAVSHLGYVEGKNNDNIFAAEVGHANNQPWCNTFICAVFKEAEEEAAVINTAAVLTTLAWAVKYNRLITKQLAKRGDLVLFNFHGSKTPEHIELAVHDFDPKSASIECIGGNTSPVISSGSQANGDGVYKKMRPVQSIVAVVRPMYKETQ